MSGLLGPDGLPLRPPVPPAPASGIGRLAAMTRGNWYAIAGAVALLAFTIALDMYDDKDAVKGVEKWMKAADLLGPDDHGSFVQQLNDWEGQYLPEDVWDADDREAFDSFIRNIKNESAAIRTACLRNAGELERVRSFYQDAIDSLGAITIPACIAAIVAIPMQYFPVTAAAAAAIGIAASAITATALVIIGGAIVMALADLGMKLNNNTTDGFTQDSKATDTTKDRDFKEISITWANHDPDFYMKPKTA
ncbi:hypothetical protein AB0M43_26255 [Longispora sp. NPDC051575]|uniref:hypothetical protein n=1 Tax=Longispora sp. NPDC051575 TaxID=3154943 RepID=UPI003415BFCF